VDQPRASRILFVTGRLAEFALRQVLEPLSKELGIEPRVAVLPITVAALMTPTWIAKRLTVPPDTDRIILPGACRGDLESIRSIAGTATVEVGPDDLRDLPTFFGQDADRLAGYGNFDIEILAEINHAPRLSHDQLISEAERFVAEGADWIDVGCEPGTTWAGIGEAIRAMRERGIRVSVDSFNPIEIEQATSAGAELVLSVNASNRDRAGDWGVEVVAIPDEPGSLAGLDETINNLSSRNIPFRVDPILEPIGFGLAASIARYVEVRRRYPELPMMMGVGNLTELTDVDSAGINTLLLGLCQELGVRSVLSTAVINWARSSIRELDLARRLVYYAVSRHSLPKRVEPRLIMLRDPKVDRHGRENLEELQRRIRDPNWRIFAEDGLLYALNHRQFLCDAEPFELFEQMGVSDPSHAFYLGWEMMKAKTALTLSKNYRQDRELSWGFLTVTEQSHQDRKRGRARHPHPTDLGAGRQRESEQESPQLTEKTSPQNSDIPEKVAPDEKAEPDSGSVEKDLR
jgi:dihydropteroate synthase